MDAGRNEQGTAALPPPEQKPGSRLRMLDRERTVGPKVGGLI